MVHRYLLVFMACLMPLLAIASPNVVPSALNGSWRGTGRIIVQWSNQKELSFELFIHTDGRVTGRIGDATFNGSVTTRSTVMRWLGNRDYLISGSLRGPIIAELNPASSADDRERCPMELRGGRRRALTISERVEA